MSVLLNPYLNFDTNAREALEFYYGVFGGELSIMTFAEGGQSQGPDDADLVMHGQLTTATGQTLMASDAPPGMPVEAYGGFSVSLSGDDDATLRGYWAGLLEGGTAVLPLEVAPWGDAFGMVADKYGVTWMVNITGAAG
ncbi:VOC family protein [Agromyces protaetiae]|uniref:VOC family protein n=1 Tax=Agromyces protaetiae TaxID=2509455 RepID=A0A4V0YH05_9MICO|nr:VOC family protein [Agromyces protaetiae]QAY73031.1 VOC family protein [Agromyces protaetiae]